MSNAFTIQATIERPKEEVWERLTHAEHITNWNFASPEWCCPNAEIDPAVGGRLSYRMESVDGKMGFDLTGIIIRYEEENAFDYRMPDGRNVRHELNVQDGNTKITQIVDPESEHPVDMQIQGWQAILNNFKKYCEQKCFKLRIFELRVSISIIDIKAYIGCLKEETEQNEVFWFDSIYN